MSLLNSFHSSAHRAQWFSKGLDSFWGRAEELALDLFQWFRSHTCQKEDFANTLEKLNLGADVFLRHVQCRWLTQIPCLERIKKGKRKVRGVPQSQTAALPRPQEEEETDKSKPAQTEQTYEKH